MTTLPTLTWTQSPYETTKVRLTSQVISHGLKDAAGREIGNFARIEERTVWEPVPGHAWHRQPTDRTEFHVTTQATRNGEKFGAFAHGTDVATLEEAQKLAAEKIAEAGKRYAKSVAKGTGKQFATKAVAR